MNKPKYPLKWHKADVWSYCDGTHHWEIIGKDCTDLPGYVYRVKRDDDYIDDFISFGDLDEAMKAAEKDIARCS